MTGGQVWTKDLSPVLVATQGWEFSNVAEPTVLAIAGGYRMWYSGGYNTEAIGTATSTDGISWTKYASNPIIGQGNGGISGSCGRSFVIKTGGYFHMYFNENASNYISHCKSVDTDGVSFDTPALIFIVPSWGVIFGNMSIVIDSGTWYMMYEALTIASSTWAIGYATSSDGLTWTDQTPSGPLTDLSIGGAYGGPDLHGTPGAWTLYYHAAPSGANLPTDIYKSTSTNLTSWTTPSLQIGRSLAWEVDQCADPDVMDQGGTTVMYYAGEDNPHETGKLSRAVLA